MGEGAWPSEMAGQGCPCHEWLDVALDCTGEALVVCVVFSSCHAVVYAMAGGDMSVACLGLALCGRADGVAVCSCSLLAL